MLYAGGFRWVRMDLSWVGTERKQGQYDFSEWDGLMKALQASHLKVIFILGYNNAHYGTVHIPHQNAGISTPELRSAYAAWTAAAVQHFQGQGILWEIWNEPNNKQFWAPAPNYDDYVKLTKEAVKRIRAATPNEVIVGPASSRINLEFLEYCFRADLLNCFDALTVHPYRPSPEGPESAIPEFTALRSTMAKYLPVGKPVFSGEWGYSTAWKHCDEEFQAKMLVRQWLVNLSQDIDLSIWYDWHDDGENKDDAESNFGVVRYPFHAGATPVYDPKPAYKAAQCLTQVLNGYKFVKRLKVGGVGDFVLLFQAGASSRVVAWSTSKTPASIRIPLERKSLLARSTAKLFSYLGESSVIQMRQVNLNNDVEIKLKDSPQYIVQEQ